MVICVFHAPFTTFPRKIERGPMTSHQIRVKENGSHWPELQELSLQVLLTEFTRTPCLIQVVEAIAMKPSSRVGEKLEIPCDRDDVVVVFPFFADVKVPEDLGRSVRFERSLYE